MSNDQAKVDKLLGFLRYVSMLPENDPKKVHG